MVKSFAGSYPNDVRSILGAIRTLPRPARSTAAGPGPSLVPFVTIKREAGAGGRSVAQRLVERLNETDPAQQSWSAWDKELVEKVSNDLDVSQKLVESIEQGSRSWLGDLFDGMRADASHVDEFKIYRQVANSIRALAQVGRVVLVGRGATFVTANMPGAIHIRLVASHPYRVRRMSEVLGIPPAQAEAEVTRLEQSRAAFLKRYWPTQHQRTDLFHLTINMELVSEARAVESILQIIPRNNQA